LERLSLVLGLGQARVIEILGPAAILGEIDDDAVDEAIGGADIRHRSAPLPPETECPPTHRPLAGQQPHRTAARRGSSDRGAQDELRAPQESCLRAAHCPGSHSQPRSPAGSASIQLRAACWQRMTRWKRPYKAGWCSD